MSLNAQRRIFRYVLLGGIALFGVYQLIEMPIIFGPRASAAARESGRELFIHEWTVNDPLAHGDGLGPVFNAKSCVACHFQGGVGGAGGSKQNVSNFTALPTTADGEVKGGTIHSGFATKELRETFELVRSQFPIIKGRTETRTQDHCTYSVTIPDIDPLRTETIQTTALFGAGWANLVSEKAILNNHRRNAIKGIVNELRLDFDSIPQGRPRYLKDGRVGKFGWKAQFATLEEFVAAACSNELGLGTPLMQQVQPLGRPNHPVPENPDLDRRQFRDLVDFVNTLPCPEEREPENAGEREKALLGKRLFKEVGCAVCHVPDIGGVKGIYTDFLLHKLDTAPPGQGGNGGYGGPNRPDVPLPVDMPEADEWKTPALWGVADSAPYLHDGSAPTLENAIIRHGGDAKLVRDAYKALKPEEQQAVVGFLKTLRAPEGK